MDEARGTSPGWRDALQAQIALLRAAWDLRTRQTGRLLSLAAGGSGEADSAMSLESESRSRGASTEEGTGGAPPELAEARRIGEAVRYVAARGVIRPRCLVQAVALKRLLDWRGLDGSAIRVGVKTESAALAAHAWVEYRGHVVGDFPEHVQKYDDLQALRVHTERDERGRPDEA